MQKFIFHTYNTHHTSVTLNTQPPGLTPKFHLLSHVTSRRDTKRYLARAGKSRMCCVALVGQHCATRSSRRAQHTLRVATQQVEFGLYPLKTNWQWK